LLYYDLRSVGYIMIEEIRVQLGSIARNVDSCIHVRIETIFTYPDGSSVDLFVVDDHLSDLGRTMEWLLDIQVRPDEYRAFIWGILMWYGVRRNGGAFEVSVRTLEGVREETVRLGRACARVAALVNMCRSICPRRR